MSSSPSSPQPKRAKIEDSSEQTTLPQSSMMSPPLPAKPSPMLLASAANEDNLRRFEESMASVQKALSLEGEARERAQTPCRNLRAKLESGLRKIHNGEDEDDREAYKTMLQELLEVCSPAVRNQGHVNSCLSAYVAMECLSKFLTTGRLVERRAFPELTSSEYLMGTLRFADELTTYATGRAMERDMASVSVCNHMIQAMNAGFLQFNLRNGPLRRRFDTLKYRVRKVEDILYELSLLFSEEEIAAIREHHNLQPTVFVDLEEFEAMVKEIDEHTEEREKVITASRNPQKESKKAIFALHRKNFKEARELFKSCENIFKEVSETTKIPHDELHAGSFGNALEEYAEGRMFEDWLLRDGALLSLEDMRKDVFITEKDYLGGVVDFTGELGRFGVTKATARDEEAVKQVLSTMLVIKDYAITLQEISGPKMVKKLEAVMNNERKMRNTLYELTLLKYSKRKTMDLSSTSDADVGADNSRMDE
eukprot:CAMPEP_0171485912 /NCGR_PEP_ID=MMETSP0958-20121227/802_1 /TAXON_ID=87120 /ORGANISM="Aurantiochytrium limacinum, Strain ATCCMYA-1381" /LENGTH=480 /DNA_ID=CAMNT_0012018741 /DNA_START=108 /DNA_END=1550 /DNA_ORIENTATION=-